MSESTLLPTSKNIVVNKLIFVDKSRIASELLLFFYLIVIFFYIYGELGSNFFEAATDPVNFCLKEPLSESGVVVDIALSNFCSSSIFDEPLLTTDLNFFANLLWTFYMFNPLAVILWDCKNTSARFWYS